MTLRIIQDKCLNACKIVKSPVDIEFRTVALRHSVSKWEKEKQVVLQQRYDLFFHHIHHIWNLMYMSSIHNDWQLVNPLSIIRIAIFIYDVVTCKQLIHA